MYNNVFYHVHHDNLTDPVLTMCVECYCLNMIFEIFKIDRMSARRIIYKTKYRS